MEALQEAQEAQSKESDLLEMIMFCKGTTYIKRNEHPKNKHLTYRCYRAENNDGPWGVIQFHIMDGKKVLRLTSYYLVDAQKRFLKYKPKRAKVTYWK